MKKASYITAIVFLFTFLIFAGPVLADEFQAGQKIFTNNCQICHGADGAGNGPASVSLSPKPADFRSPAFWQKTTRQQMEHTIKNGKAMMPAFSFSQKKVNAVLDYISHKFKPAQ